MSGIYVNNGQRNVISGSVFDAAIATTAEKFRQGRVPAIGHRVAFKDGRVFYFAKAGGTITAGQVVQHTPNSQAIAATYFGVSTSVAPVAGEGGAIGDTQVRLTADVATVTADEYAGGYLNITDATGEGYSYRIKSNAATATGGFLVQLYDPIVVALDNTSVGTMVANIFDGVLTHVAGDYNGTTTVFIVGKAVRGASSGEYFWVQTWGPALLKAGAVAIKIGGNVSCSIDLHGAAQCQECVTTETQAQLIGAGITAAAASGNIWGMVNLMIMP